MLKESLSNACTRSSTGDILNPQANVACTSRIFHLEEMFFNVWNHGLSQLRLSQDHNHKCIYRPVKQSKEELILLGIREHFWNETKLTSDQTKQ